MIRDIFAPLNNPHSISLKPYNTFGVDVNCREIIPFGSVEELRDVLKGLHKTQTGFMVLGGGSNMLFTKDYPGTVLLNRIKGISVITENSDESVVEAGSGEVWHELVLYCVDHGLGGIENLSLIPGCVGAAPIQNIGAYGVELKDVFESLTAMDIRSGEIREFTGDECGFGYRDSVFKGELKGRYIITSLKLRLSRKPFVNTTYGAIGQVLKERGISSPGIKDVSDAVIHIRSSKLPDPKVLGNSGSFFKNPVVGRQFYFRLQNNFPEMPRFLVDDDHVKIPAGWLIEHCGFKGKRYGNTGCHEKQALVIVNYGNATGSEIYKHARRVIKAVKEKFEIELETEVNIL